MPLPPRQITEEPWTPTPEQRVRLNAMAARQARKLRREGVKTIELVHSEPKPNGADMDMPAHLKHDPVGLLGF